VIPNISRGDDAGGLIRYLGGPSKQDGRHINFHEDQRVIGGSLGVTGPLDAELQEQVIADLRAPGLAHPDVKVTVKVKGKNGEADTSRDGPIWHCSLSLKAGEGPLSDEQWREISDGFMSKMGFDDPSLAPSRWVAVRHGLSEEGNDHCHIAASLIREDGRVVDTYRDRNGRRDGDFARAQTACGELERSHGLDVLVSREAGTGAPGVTGAELDYARKVGASETEREALTRTVRSSAAASKTEGEFVRRMRGAGVSITPRLSKAGAVTGYRVDGVQRSFGAPDLARDLTLPRLRAGWRGDPAAARAVWAGDATPGREVGVLRLDKGAYRKATAELRGMEKRLVVGGLSLAEIAAVSHSVAGALSAAATLPEYARGEVPKAARDAGRMASGKTRGPVPLVLAASLIFMQAQERDGLAQAVMVRQLLATYRAVQGARQGMASGKGKRVLEPDGLDEVADVGVTMGVTAAAVGWEKHSREAVRPETRDTLAWKVALADTAAERGEAVAKLAALDAAPDPFREPVSAPEPDRTREPGWQANPSVYEDPAEFYREYVKQAESVEAVDPKRRPPGEWKTGGEPLTAKQRVVLLNRGIGVAELDGMSKAAASERIGAKQQVGNVTSLPVQPDPKQQVRPETRGRHR
jgi:hypothetical protein